MISEGGFVFRIVTASSPGDPALEEFGCVRTEFLAWSFGWTLDRAQALHFPTHLAANLFANSQGWYAMVNSRDNSPEIPERLRPLPFDPLPPPPGAARLKKKKKRKSRARMPVLGARRDWVMETYG